MNAIGWIILVALVGNYAVSTVVAVLNLRAMSSTLPVEFEGTFEETSYRKSQEYTRAKTRLGIVGDAVGLVVLVTFWQWGGFQALDELLRGFHWSDTVTGIAYIGTLMIAQSIVDVPFSVYATFVLEERFGFNRTTPLTFVLDRVKGLMLAAAIGIPMLAAVLTFFANTGELAWLYCWALVVLFSLLMQYAAPTLIMPLFNKFTPLDDGDLRSRILDMTARAGFPIRNVMVIDGSKRSSKSNAFFTGFGSQKRIALYDTLVEQHTEDELVAVLAHEVGHYKKHHIIQGAVVSIIHTGILFFLLSQVLDFRPLFETFYVSDPSIYTGLIFFGLLLSPVELILGLAMNALSRRNEYDADRYAATLTGSAESLISALKRLSHSNLSNLTPHPSYVRLYYSHPPVLERIQALRNL
ncbi:MAG TPA: M48 family metallopeptidase [Rhodothermia bacterium]